MSNPALFGYLETAYLVYPYLGEFAEMSYGAQVKLVVNGSKAIGSQIKGTINSKKAIGEQTKGQIANHPDAIGSQTKLVIASSKPIGSQIKGQIANHPDPIGSQIKGEIVNHLKPVGMQTDFVIIGRGVYGLQVKGKDTHSHATGMQAHLTILDGSNVHGFQYRHDNFASWCVGGYLIRPYLEDPYLTCIEGGQFGAQAKGLISKHPRALGSQAHLTINGKKTIGQQVRLIIHASRAYGMQVQNFKQKTFGSQVTFVLYNATNLRILDVFPSRGLNGLSWTANSTASGDFGANNLNTDIVEQQWRSAPSVVTGITLTCDTQVTSVFVDTVAILNHNLTTSAVVVLEGSNDPLFGTVGTTIPIQILKRINNAYYIAPTLPTAGFRYWRFIINDPTNTDGQIKIGTILFGPSIIFQGDNITDNIVRKLVHFADKIPTEGYTDVMNDRALKYGVTLEFKNLDYTKGNYQQLDQVFQFARTSLKCLWIPDPQSPERFAVFAKMKQIPDSQHNNLGPTADYVSLNIELDESL